MVDFVRPSILGSKSDFMNRFERPISNGQCVDSRPFDIQLMKERTHVLQLLLHGFVQRRDHKVLLKSLPPCHEIIVPVLLSPIQETIYTAFLNSGSRALLSGFAYLTKVWNHPDVLFNHWNAFLKDSVKQPLVSKVYRPGDTEDVPLDLDSPAVSDNFSNNITIAIEEEADFLKKIFANYESLCVENSFKFKISLDIIDAAVNAGEKVLFFSQSISALNCFEQFLEGRRIPNSDYTWEREVSFLRIDGQVHVTNRNSIINKFNDPMNTSVKLLLVSTKAGGIGINLVGASRVIILDVAWNPCHDSQALCRVFRYGQTKETFVYRLMAVGTMENVIYSRCVLKQGISRSVVDELSLNRSVSKDEVDGLFLYRPPTRDSIKLGSKLPFEDEVFETVYQSNKGCLGAEPYMHNSLLEVNEGEKLTDTQRKEAVRNFKTAERTSAELNQFSQNYSKVMGGVPGLDSAPENHIRGRWNSYVEPDRPSNRFSSFIMGVSNPNFHVHNNISRTKILEMQRQTAEMRNKSRELLEMNAQGVDSVSVGFNRNPFSSRPVYSSNRNLLNSRHSETSVRNREFSSVGKDRPFGFQGQ